MNESPTPRPEPRIVVEAIGPLARLALQSSLEHDEPLYWVSRLRGAPDCLSSTCSVLYTRRELEELRRRIDAALVVG